MDPSAASSTFLHSTTMSRSAQRKTYHASCLCRGVKFTLTGEPFLYFVCNCRNCKQTSGSAFLANPMFKHRQLSIDQGEELVRDYTDTNTLSGNANTRSFCGKCGSNLFIKPTKGDVFAMHPSQIEEPITWVPTIESHGHERVSWVKEIVLQVKPKTKL